MTFFEKVVGFRGSLQFEEVSIMGDTISNGSTIVVDYSATVKDLISRGDYGEIHPVIYSVINAFKVSNKDGKFELPINIVHSEKVLSTQVLTSKLKNKRLRNASTEEILTLGFSYPNLQHKFKIVGLNSICTVGDDKYVLCLNGNKSVRKLTLLPLEGEWSSNYRFLVFDLDYEIKKISESIIRK